MLIVEEHQSRFHEKITGKELHATGVKHKVQTWERLGSVWDGWKYESVLLSLPLLTGKNRKQRDWQREVHRKTSKDAFKKRCADSCMEKNEDRTKQRQSAAPLKLSAIVYWSGHTRLPILFKTGLIIHLHNQPSISTALHISKCFDACVCVCVINHSVLSCSLFGPL